MTKLAILGAAAIEGLLLVIALLRVDWADDTHVLLFIFSILGYTIIALGLVALGAYVWRVGAANVLQRGELLARARREERTEVRRQVGDALDAVCHAVR